MNEAMALIVAFLAVIAIIVGIKALRCNSN